MCRWFFQTISIRLVLRPCASAMTARQRICGERARNTAASHIDSFARRFPPPAWVAPAAASPEQARTSLLWALTHTQAIPSEQPPSPQSEASTQCLLCTAG